VSSSAAAGGSITVFVLGAGRAGRSLARALRASGVDVVGLHGRHHAADDATVTIGSLPRSLQSASVVLVTVRDAQLDGALTELATAQLAPRAIVLHASGSVDPVELDTLRRAGHPCGTMHPLVPLADPLRAEAALRAAWIGVDGDAAAVAAARALAASLGARTLDIPPGGKGRYHAAAVLAANFPTVLASLAERLLAEAGVDADEARLEVRGLMAASVDNLRTAAPEAVLTGPIARGDTDSVRRHLRALSSDSTARRVYIELSEATLALARHGGTPEERLSEISALLAEARMGGRTAGMRDGAAPRSRPVANVLPDSD